MRFLTLLALLGLPAPVLADDLFDSGKLLATGGVSQVEGAGGGGLANWAMITGYGSRDGAGANVHYTVVPLTNYSLQSAGIAVGLFDRLELSYAWQGFDTQNVGAVLGVEPLCYRTGHGYGMQLKDMLVVTANGCEMLSDYCSNDELIVVR
jgi:hypothetical protein